MKVSGEHKLGRGRPVHDSLSLRLCGSRLLAPMIRKVPVQVNLASQETQDQQETQDHGTSNEIFSLQ